MRTSFHHQSEAQSPNGPLTAATSPDTPSPGPTVFSFSCVVHARMFAFDSRISLAGQRNLDGRGLTAEHRRSDRGEQTHPTIQAHVCDAHRLPTTHSMRDAPVCI